MLETVRERQSETNNKTEIAMWLVYVYLVLPCGSLFYIYIYIYILPKKKIIYLQLCYCVRVGLYGQSKC